MIDENFVSDKSPGIFRNASGYAPSYVMVAVLAFVSTDTSVPFPFTTVSSVNGSVYSVSSAFHP